MELIALMDAHPVTWSSRGLSLLSFIMPSQIRTVQSGRLGVDSGMGRNDTLNKLSSLLVTFTGDCPSI